MYPFKADERNVLCLNNKTTVTNFDVVCFAAQVKRERKNESKDFSFRFHPRKKRRVKKSMRVALGFSATFVVVKFRKIQSTHKGTAAGDLSHPTFLLVMFKCVSTLPLKK